MVEKGLMAVHDQPGVSVHIPESLGVGLGSGWDGGGWSRLLLEMESALSAQGMLTSHI